MAFVIASHCGLSSRRDARALSQRPVTRAARRTLPRCDAAGAPPTAEPVTSTKEAESVIVARRLTRKPGVVRVAIPSKGSIFEQTKELLRQIGCDLRISNPRQYIATLKGLPRVEIWLQRPSDIARKVRDGTVDLGFCGTDLSSEYGGSDNEIVTIHEDLRYGACRLGLGVPMSWDSIETVDDLTAALQSPDHPKLRVATKFSCQASKFFAAHGIDNYELVAMDGALEASTQMGTADCIVDLISSGTTLRENLLKEIDGGTILESTFQLIGNRQNLSVPNGDSATDGGRLRAVTRELLERIEAFVAGQDCYNLIANIRGTSPGDVARRLGSRTSLAGLDGPTISTVIPPRDSKSGMYAVGVIVSKADLYPAVCELRTIGGSGVCVLPVTYVFERDSARWKKMVEELGLAPEDPDVEE